MDLCFPSITARGGPPKAKRTAGSETGSDEATGGEGKAIEIALSIIAIVEESFTMTEMPVGTRSGDILSALLCGKCPSRARKTGDVHRDGSRAKEVCTWQWHQTVICGGCIAYVHAENMIHRVRVLKSEPPSSFSSPVVFYGRTHRSRAHASARSLTTLSLMTAAEQQLYCPDEQVLPHHAESCSLVLDESIVSGLHCWQEVMRQINRILRTCYLIFEEQPQ